MRCRHGSGAGHQTSLNYCIWIKSCDAQFSRLHHFQQGVIPQLYGLWVFFWVMIYPSKGVMLVPFLQWFLRSMTVLALVRKCTNHRETIPLLGYDKLSRTIFGIQSPGMNFDSLLLAAVMWTIVILSMLYWGMLLGYNSPPKCHQVSGDRFLDRWFSEP